MTKHALFVGVNEYVDRTIIPLGFAERDATELYGLFKRSLNYGQNTHLLESPTRDEVFEKIDDIGQNVRAGDSFVFFFAGHGYESTRNADQYLLLKQVRLDEIFENRSRVPRGVISILDLVDETKRWVGVGRVFLFDACRIELQAGRSIGGTPIFGSDKTLNRIATRDLLLRTQKKSETYVFIKACLSGQRAHELTERGGSIFRLALEDVLLAAVASNEAVVTNRDFLEELALQMSRLADIHGLPNEQQPWISDGATEIVIFDPIHSPLPAGRGDTLAGEAFTRQERLRDERKWKETVDQSQIVGVRAFLDYLSEASSVARYKEEAIERIRSFQTVSTKFQTAPFSSNGTLKTKNLSSSNKESNTSGSSVVRSLQLSQHNLCWIDINTTGPQFNSDRILEIAVVITDSFLTLRADGPTLAIHVSDQAIDSMDNLRSRPCRMRFPVLGGPGGAVLRRANGIPPTLHGALVAISPSPFGPGDDFGRILMA